MTWFNPRNINMPASVTMNAGTITRETQNPCQAPTRIPTTRPTRMPTGQATPQSAMTFATTIPVNAATEPTERSMCPAMITITMPIARIRM